MWTKTIYQQQKPNYCTPNDRKSAAVNSSMGIPTNIKKNDEEIILYLALPAFEKSEINIKIVDQELIISTTPNDEEKTFTRQEFKKHAMKRVFRLPENVDKEQITANHENGILTIHIKKVIVEQKTIQIN